MILPGFLATVAGLVLGYYRLFVPWFNYFGVDESEKDMALPGDHLVPDPASQTMRAITIDAPPPEVWKWLVQIGGYRAGWYSHTWAENLFGMGIYNKYEIRPEWQTLEKGDPLVFNKFGHCMIVQDVVPNESLVLFTDTRRPVERDLGTTYYASTDQTVRVREFHPFPAKGYEEYDAWWSWVFHLKELPDGRTRLISRYNSDWFPHGPIIGWIFRNAIETPHGIMEIEMFRQLKDCAEGRASKYRNTPLPHGGVH